MTVDRHTFHIDLQDDTSPSVSVVCPYEKNDRDRPCWARNDAGGLDEASADDCNYVEWLDNVGFDMVAGHRRLYLSGARIEWDAGNPVLHVDLDREHRNAVDRANAEHEGRA